MEESSGQIGPGLTDEELLAILEEFINIRAAGRALVLALVTKVRDATTRKALTWVINWLLAFEPHLTPDEWTQQKLVVLQLRRRLDKMGFTPWPEEEPPCSS